MLKIFSRGLRSSIPILCQRRFVSVKMVDAVVEKYKSIAQLSDIKRAQILNVTENAAHSTSDIYVQVTWSARNLSAMERSLTNCDYVIQGENVLAFPPVPGDKNVILSQHSNTGNKSAYIGVSEKDKDAQFVMIFEKNGSMKSIDLKAADKHGKVYADVEFSCLEWSSDESKLLYVAEKKRPKATSFMAKVKNNEDEDTRGQEFVYIDEWGEQLEGKHQSVICVLNVETGEVSCHTLPNDLCPGQLIWAPDDSGIFGVAFVSTPYRLGLIYCPIRESKLFFMNLEGDYSEVIQGHYSIRTPRLSPDGSRVAFLRSTVGGPHAKSSQLCLVSWPGKEERVIIDVIPRERSIEEGHKFMGIYGYSGMPRRCWLNDSKRLVFSTYKFDTIVTYVVNVDSGAIVELPHVGSQNVLDVFSSWLLLDSSYICQPSQIMLGQVPIEGQERSIKLKEITPRRSVESIQSNYHSHWQFVNEVPHPDPKYSDIPISVIYFGPTKLDSGAAKRPLICWPHGGPHTTLANVFYASAAFFVKLGYSIVFANYRGSLGFGEDGVNALPGYCGTVDVSDVHQATLSCLQRFSHVLDPDQVLLFGGSHGGFLVTHLAAQYPDTYKAVSARNPVTDISGISNVTDIPDWCFVETGNPFKHGDIPNSEILGKMYQMSPISHIDKLKAPTLLLVGKNDKRVSPYNGIHYHKMLLARGVKTELLIYDDCHPLSKVDVEIDSLIHTALWFEKYRRQEP